MSENQSAAKSQDREHSPHLARNMDETMQQAALYAVEQLVAFAQDRGLISLHDTDYSRNLLLDQFGFSEPYTGGEAGGVTAPEVLQPVLNVLIDYGFAIGLIPENTDTYRDLLDSKIMGLLMARPSEVIRDFHQTKAERGIEAATNAFYRLSIDSNYIRMDRVASNVYWNQPTPYGDMEITINLSKPEKSPKEIAMATLLPPPVYPKCQLCRENVGYAGRVNHPSRQNLRIIPVELNGEPWFFQYSPYVYYNEHCIVFHHDHVPMKLTKDTLRQLLAFTKAFPHYFIGSNADLPIVGGSILTHDHFQGGRHTFPIEKAGVDSVYYNKAFPQVTAGIVNWPMSVIRFASTDAEALLEAGNAAFEAWKAYSDPAADVLSHTEQEGETIPHNTVTPIVRRDAQGRYQMDLVLRNNRTSDEYPEGIFHPHREMHHIKKENIGLIEVMGLAILPGRLKDELDGIADILCGNDELAAAMQEEEHPLYKHADWIYQLNARFGHLSDKETAVRTVQNEVGLKFSEILEHAGVYKRNPSGLEAFGRFMKQLGFTLGE